MPDQNLCLCGCGTPVANKWVRGHVSRGVDGFRLTAVPGPDDPVWDADPVDVGELAPAQPPPVAPGAPPEPEPAPPADDEPPAHARREWGRAPKAAKARPPKITVGVRNDITAKIAFPLQVFGSIWQARDPLCGGVFIDQTAATAEALTSIVCESADLVRFFTGPGGAFMRWLEVGAALMPVAQVVAAHHVYHSVEIVPEGEQQPEPARYAA